MTQTAQGHLPPGVLSALGTAPAPAGPCAGGDVRGPGLRVLCYVPAAEEQVGRVHLHERLHPSAGGLAAAEYLHRGRRLHRHLPAPGLSPVPRGCTCSVDPDSTGGKVVVTRGQGDGGEQAGESLMGELAAGSQEVRESEKAVFPACPELGRAAAAPSSLWDQPLGPASGAAAAGRCGNVPFRKRLALAWP